MPFYKLINALPQSAPGNQETHYGCMCQVRVDGIYCDFAKELGDLFVSVGRCYETEDIVATVEVVSATTTAETVGIEPTNEATVENAVVETTAEHVAETTTIVADSATETPTPEGPKKAGRPKAVK